MADAGNVAWDMGSYQWLLQGQDFPSIHPSLQRQAVLNMAYGLYEVVPGRIYQVRGYDLANISFIKGDTGWIVFDPLTSQETARAALEFINEKLGKRPVVGVVYSHTHGDHFGGVRGVVDEADVVERQGDVDRGRGVHGCRDLRERVRGQRDVAAPAVAVRRAAAARSRSATSTRRSARTSPHGNVGLIAPNRLISKNIEEITLDGVKMVFQNAPDTEAPVEMNTYFPQFKAFWSSEVVTGTIHNIYTLRGAAVRNAINWSKEINEALYMFGGEAEVMFASHSWPRWGNARIQEVLRTQRDAYANLNNQTLHYVNQGVTINEIHNVYDVPQSLQQSWAARSYHGDVQNNVRGVVNRFLGHFDGNPANLIPLSPSDSAPLYVEMMGGSDKIIARARELVAQGKYLHATEILNRLVFAEPKNQPARQLLADTYEQLGYQAESTSVRNTFLQGAFELRNGMPGGVPPRSTGPDVVRAMTTGQWLDFLGISMDPKKAAGAHLTLNLVTPDNGEKYAVELSNATLTNIEGFQAAEARPHAHAQSRGPQPRDDGRGDLRPARRRKARRASTATGRSIAKLRDLLVTFTPDFEILPGTAPTQRQVPPGRPFSLPETSTLIHPE